MSFKKNIIANYVGQAYKALIGVIVMPLYLSYLGAEAYGLIGFFVMLQAALQVLDMGLRPTLAREASRYCASTLSINSLKSLLHSMEIIFSILAILFLVSVYFNNIWIAEKWLNIQLLSVDEVTGAINIMAIVIALRWTVSIYRGIISGFEHQVWLNSYDIIVSSFRYLGILFIFTFFEASIYVFFFYQLIVSIIESIVIFKYTYKILPKSNLFSFSIKPLQNIYRFALSIAFTSALWTAVTQVDKLLLSHSLQLSQYGYFSLAITVSSGIYILGNAIGTALMPKLTILSEKKKYLELEHIYLLSREISIVILAPISAMLVFFGYEIVYLWTGDSISAQYVHKIIVWYTLGNLMLSMSGFGYYIQYTKGNLKLHVKGQIIFALFVIPSQAYVAAYYGAIGTGIVWFVANLTYLVVWVGLIHKKYLIYSHFKWLLEILTSISVSFIVVYLLYSSIDMQNKKELIQFIILMAIWTVTVVLTIISTKNIRAYIYNYIMTRKDKS